MWFLANTQINRLAAHSTLHQLAWSVGGIFLAVFLLRAGVPAYGVFLSVAGIVVLRFVLRPLVLWAVPTFGPRRTLIVATFFFASRYPLLTLVHGPGWELLLFCMAAALGEAFYWTTYHIFFAVLGDSEYRGSQLGAFQALGAAAAISGPIVGGLALANFGPWAAFGTAALIEVLAVLPILGSAEPRISRIRPRDAYAAAKIGVYLMGADGWMVGSSALAWDMIAFQALHERYDMFGGTLAAGALAAALSGLLLGRYIDAGHARRAVWISAAVSCGILVFKSLCGFDPARVIFVAVASTALGGIYHPSLMTAFYNEAKAAPCPLRFQFAAEGGWDVGVFLACSAAAAASVWGVSLQAIILFALPAVGLQARLLHKRYCGRLPSHRTPVLTR